MGFEIDTAAKRARLPARKNPYWRGIAGGRSGVSLGYRKRTDGAGAWIAKVVAAGQRAEARIGPADDEPVVPGAIGYRTAVAKAIEWSVREQAALEATSAAPTGARRPTVQTAVEDYIAQRVARGAAGRDARSRLRLYVLSDDVFTKTPLHRLQATTIEEWRERLPSTGKRGKPMLKSSVNRLLNDLRAALNAAGLKHRRTLPASYVQEVRVGAKVLEANAQARRQLLTDAQVRSIVSAAFEVDESGDFGRLVTLLAATGARLSQAAACQVAYLQPENERVMMPGSQKGRRRREKPLVAVPIAAEAMRLLAPAAAGRRPDEPLLQRWYHRQVGQFTWGRDSRRGWGPASGTVKWWAATLERAGLPADTVMYALRHSSIVRGLRAMLPVRLVAALHDTSTEMLERHYAAFIVDMTEDLARRAAISFTTAPMTLPRVA